jgi:hypothetical protein
VNLPRIAGWVRPGVESRYRQRQGLALAYKDFTRCNPPAGRPGSGLALAYKDFTSGDDRLHGTRGRHRHISGTGQDVLNTIREAIELYVEDCNDAGDPIPTEAGKEFVEVDAAA